MQLILAMQSTEGVKLNMSTQAESAVNGDISDIRNGINDPNKENNPKMNDGTIANPMKTLSKEIETESDRLLFETAKETVLKDETSQDSNTNGNKNIKCNIEEIHIVEPDVLINNINNIVNESNTNSNSQDENESECENPNMKMTTENIAETKDFNQTSSSDEKSTVMTEKDMHPLTINVKLSKLEFPISDATTTDVSNDIVPERSPESSKAHPDLKLQEEKSSSTEEDFDTINTLSQKVSETSGASKEDIENDTKSKATKTIDERTNCGLIITKDVSSDCIEEPVNVIKNKEIYTNDNIITMEEDINKPSAVPEDIPMSNEAKNVPDETFLEKEKLLTIDVKHTDDVDMVEELNKSSESSLEHIAINEVGTSNLEKHIEKEKLQIVDIKHVDVELVEEIYKASDKTEDILMIEKADTLKDDKKTENEKFPTVDVKHVDIEMVEETDKPSNKSEDTSLSEEADTFKHENNLMNERLRTSDVKNVEDVEMVEDIDEPSAERVDILVNNKLSMLPVDKIVEGDKLALGEEKHHEEVAVHEVVKSYIDDNEEKKSLESKEESIAMHDEKLNATAEESLKGDKYISAQKETSSPKITCSDQKKLPVMEEVHHNNLIAEPEPISINENVIADKLEPTKEKVLLNSFSTIHGNNKPVVSATEICDKKDLVNNEKESENVPMEVDDVEIVDLDNDKISKSGTLLSEEINVVDITELVSTPEKAVDKSTTEQHLTSKDMEVRDMSESTENKNTSEVSTENEVKKLIKDDQEKVEILDEDDVKIVENKKDDMPSKAPEKEISSKQKESKPLPIVCKLSNTLDILSDDEEDPSKVETNKPDNSSVEKQCINIDDDDDIMLIEEDSNSKEATNENEKEIFNDKQDTQSKLNDEIDFKTGKTETTATSVVITDLSPKINEKDSSLVNNCNIEVDIIPQNENISEEKTEKKKPLLSQDFLKTAKKNLVDMTRDELEDFCILRIVESIVDRSNLSEIKTKIKIMAQNLEDYRKRAMMLTKQNRDLQVVLKSVQEEQKKCSNVPIQPLKITRSVGMQVLMNDKMDARKMGPIPVQPPTTPTLPAGKPVRSAQKIIKAPGTPGSIPVPRKVPVNNSPAKSLASTPVNNVGKTASPTPNGLRNPSPVQKAPEKRTHSKMQATSSVTVDLTDDEPPPKIISKNSTLAPVRVVPPQNLLAQQRPFAPPLNNPRKVYIPISGPQGQAIRPGQTLMVKTVPPSGPRPRAPMPRMPQTPIRINKQVAQRHPAPLPDAMKQYTPPTWKALPPAPDLKLSKVENGIVISWKIDGYPEGGYETIASYQLYAYQETTAPPNTALWKKIGDVKALPLPMACTLTQFMAGFKYYFAVRAVDIRSRLGPFSLPGSILLLHKV